MVAVCRFRYWTALAPDRNHPIFMLDYNLPQGLDNYTNKCIRTARLGRIEPSGAAGISAGGASHFRCRAVCRAAWRDAPPDAKPLRGFGGAGVLELIEDHRGDTCWPVYTVRFATEIYVLHAFQKKSKRGIATPKHEIELIRERLKWAERLHTGKAKEG